MVTKRPDIIAQSDNGSRTDYDHDAFGAISVYKTNSGKGVPLFGSALKHDQFVSIELSRAILIRDYNEDRHFSTDTITRFAMSEAQWARFVSSVGNGDGVPVTLERAPPRGTSCVRSPGIDMENERVRYTQDVKREFQKVLSDIAGIKKQLEDLTVGTTASKTGLRQVISNFDTAMKNIPGNVAYLQERFIRTMENIVQDSKIEVETFVKNAAIRHRLPLAFDTNNNTLLVSNTETDV